MYRIYRQFANLDLALLAAARQHDERDSYGQQRRVEPKHSQISDPLQVQDRHDRRGDQK
jgi:hypothetical protein